MEDNTVDPMTMTALAIGASGVAQLFTGLLARNASSERLKEVKKLYESLIPPNYDLSITDPPELHMQRLQMPEFTQSEEGIKWASQALDPKKLKLIEKFVPQVAERIIEADPTLIEKTEDMKLGSEAEKKALRRFMEVGEGEFDPVYQQRVKEARDRAQAEAQSRNAAIQQDFERRGIGGSGLELAAKIGSSADSMNRMAQMGLDAEAQAYQNQLQALSQGANLGGRIQDREISKQARNAAIINAFNERMSRRHQDWEQMRSNALNQADLRNIAEAQRIADFNTRTQNQYDRDRQARMDNMALRNYQARMDERNRQDALNKWRYAQEGKERAYQDNAAILGAKWRQDQKRYGNQMRSQAYQDQLGRLAGMSGIGRAQSQQALMAGRDQNQAIQGMMNMGMLYQQHQDKLKSGYYNNPNTNYLMTQNYKKSDGGIV